MVSDCKLDIWKTLFDLIYKCFSSIFTSENVEKIPESKPVFKRSRIKLQDIKIIQSLIYEKLKMLKQNKNHRVDNFAFGVLNKVTAQGY